MFFQRQVKEGIVADNEAAAQVIVQQLRQEATACRTPSTGSVSPSASHSVSPSAGPSATPAASPSPSVSPSQPAKGCQGLG